MPIDFPANPTNGMVYGNWIYDSSITSWRNVNTDTGIGTLNAMGLKNVVPTSVSVSAGSAVVNGNGTITFTNARDVNLAGIFTSQYKFYKIIADTKTSATSEVVCWFTNNGTNIAAGWYGAEWQVSYAGSGSAAALRNNGNGGWFTYSQSGSYQNNSQLDLLVDQSANTPQYNVSSYSRSAGISFHGGYGTDGACNGFRISPLGGGVTMTGTIRVYGYNQ